MIRGLNRIRELQSKYTLSEMIEIAENDDEISVCSNSEELERLIRFWPFWKFIHAGARGNPCLYLSILIFAYAVNTGKAAKMNVLLSTDDFSMRDCHCWVSFDGEILPKHDKIASDINHEELYHSGKVIYWWRRAAVEEKSGIFKNLLCFHGRRNG